MTSTSPMVRMFFITSVAALFSNMPPKAVPEGSIRKLYIV